MECFTSQDLCSYSFYFDLDIRFRAQKIIRTLEKRAPGVKIPGYATKLGWFFLILDLSLWENDKTNQVQKCSRYIVNAEKSPPV